AICIGTAMAGIMVDALRLSPLRKRFCRSVGGISPQGASTEGFRRSASVLPLAGIMVDALRLSPLRKQFCRSVGGISPQGASTEGSGDLHPNAPGRRGLGSVPRLDSKAQRTSCLLQPGIRTQGFGAVGLFPRERGK